MADGGFYWIVDFAGFGLSHAMNVRMGTTTLEMMSAHLPERLHKAILVNPPRVFDILLAAVTLILDSRTMSKVHTVHASGQPQLAVELAKHGLPDDAAAWVAQAHEIRADPGSGTPPLPRHMVHLQLPSSKRREVAAGVCVEQTNAEDDNS